AEERLSFDIQRDIAVRLGYTAHPGLRDVERFMKHYFLTAKHVGDLTGIFCAGLEERQATRAPVLSRMMARFRTAPSPKKLSDDSICKKPRITLPRADVSQPDPINLTPLFRLGQQHNLEFHPAAMRAAPRSLKLIDKAAREDAEPNRLFLEILTAPDAAEI